MSIKNIHTDTKVHLTQLQRANEFFGTFLPHDYPNEVMCDESPVCYPSTFNHYLSDKGQSKAILHNLFPIRTALLLNRFTAIF